MNYVISQDFLGSISIWFSTVVFPFEQNSILISQTISCFNKKKLCSRKNNNKYKKSRTVGYVNKGPFLFYEARAWYNLII